MRNTPLRSTTAALHANLTAAQNSARKACALALAERLDALALHIDRHTLNGVEAAELIRQEAERHRHALEEMH
ncbi:DUF2732 domain-containing protein [Pantoea sp. Mb-10]|uniref:DUF2732 family protein n=1 Tax=unclassified Pantoea TaxID=2630326 RepID=UPI001E2D5FE1|nr:MULTISPECIES: DUF2732 family protein [unclassified Pantoea]MCE0489969.1 DUF2732 domain-containing protein [Pantoea sp. Mb-10]MCE0500924.1 DUF2732 domain-containing protein [Pantoea sp. Pb-8]